MNKYQKELVNYTNENTLYKVYDIDNFFNVVWFDDLDTIFEEYCNEYNYEWNEIKEYIYE